MSVNDLTCLVCDATRPADVGEWRRIDMNGGRNVAGPFCSTTCEMAFEQWPLDQKYRVIFGNDGIGRYLMGENPKAQPQQVIDRPGSVTYRPVFVRDREECQHSKDWPHRQWVHDRTDVGVVGGRYECPDDPRYQLVEFVPLRYEAAS